MLIETKYYNNGGVRLTEDLIYKIAEAIFGEEKPRMVLIKYPKGMRLEENIEVLNGREFNDMELLLVYEGKNSSLPEKITIYKKDETVVKVNGNADVINSANEQIRQLLGL
ncbi:MAG: hypothetical protein Q7J54_01030 [Candidatus Woesearchaeota archaeon]|nr:hypothetical protein [Candidatus Woesearchaeota archaeon]